MKNIITPPTLNLFSFFHLNLAYSAIEIEQHHLVIEKCYWPLLRLARKRRLPFGIELSGFTLERIQEIDPSWVAELRSLLSAGLCELIGCGYAQVIGPLVPDMVTLRNLQIGNQVYEDYLGVRPSVALLNEQVYSAGMVKHYLDAGYKAIIMEWDNPSRGRAEWNPEWRYLPQIAKGADGQIPVIWNQSIAFQKFQRYVHGELSLNDFLTYLKMHKGSVSRVFSLYGNDVEVFDFRPGRYMTESPLHADGEWRRIDALYGAVQSDQDFSFIKPSKALMMIDQIDAGNILQLERASIPIPVKKQDKYNPVRWAVTGRNDLYINTVCWKISDALSASPEATADDWKELCYLWSSDFRTHITESRWRNYLARLNHFSSTWIHNADYEAKVKNNSFNKFDDLVVHSNGLKIIKDGHFLIVEGDRIRVALNCLRGMALDSFTDRKHCEVSLCGTIQHGYFDDIGWGADYYSGHLVFESPGRHKITDLLEVDPVISHFEGGVTVFAIINTPLGKIEKSWHIYDKRGEIRLAYKISWPEKTLGSLRLGYMTLLPDKWDQDTLMFVTHNGGSTAETFYFSEAEVNHGKAVSFLVSSNQLVGVTKGVLRLSDSQHAISMSIDKSKSALIALVSNHKVGSNYFTRAVFSAREVDDTSKPASFDDLCIDMCFKYESFGCGDENCDEKVKKL
jgi:hypothetical protein